MAIAVRSVWDPFGALVRQRDGEFDRLVRRAFGTGTVTGFVPAADVVRDGSDVVVTLELPGVDIDNDVQVEVVEGRLRVSGNRSEQKSSDKDGIVVRETRFGSFHREFALPEHVTADDVDADYDRGLLKIRVRGVSKPKVEPRRIQVRSIAPAQAEDTAIE
ncbi:Hsp20/alpha crystallin family protein [Labedaea rhizosphaerae]|uniref:HSP20 family protein n=1 Tax=Labedaea rhizosphaerae TaxID=598644 RepID=A0A4R6SMC8_LABRH|nr:Hsp20/alpha crystallin family protein [Labedaea rhizosphaerae]TDQ05041.1 HSP20 family protein [Labedaea rhizosphaerae]